MIKVLPKDVADKIAAGEVIESPVSIVKELVENSIDAGATSITCEITKGGKEEIRITDNGCGIPKDEVATAFLRHATSKISKAEDLKHLETLGFRGEALASIAAVSRTELITKTAEEKTGTRIIIHGGNVISNDSIGCPVGTTIIVKDLFYNMPARGKFMKSEAAEAGKIIDMMCRLALTKTDIKFTLISNGKNYFNSPGTGNIKAAVLSVYKDREYKELIELPYPLEDNSPIKVYGLLSRPSFTRSNRRSQFFFVNGRAVKSNILEKAVDLGYKERLFEGRHPIVFLFVDVNPEKLDVNVHPNKKEVRFNDEIAVITAVENTIIKAITSKDSVIKSTDSFKPDLGKEKKHSKEREEQQIGLKTFLALEDSPTYCKDTFEVSSDNKNNNHGVNNDERDVVLGTPDINEHILKPFDFDELYFQGTVLGTYIIATDQQGFYLFDQHAAHERVNYEKFINAYLSEKKESQIILTPFTVDVPLDLTYSDNEWIDILNSMGYNIEAFGDNTYIVREIPTFMTLEESENFVNVFIDSYNDDRKTTNQVVIDKLITKACKSSIKANDYIKDNEIAALIEDLKNCRNPFSCPHGRPTFIKFSKYDIEKMFKRIQ